VGTTRISLLLALGAGFLSAAPEASTALAPPAAPSQAEATVTVTAEAVPVPVARTPNPVRVLDKAAIDASGAHTLGELLGGLFPGQILNAGGVGTASSLFLGGSRNQDVIVTLDGIRLSDSAGVGGVNVATLGLAGIDRVEVQLGPCSSTFGSDAMGGVVALSSAYGAKAGVSGEAKAALGTLGVRAGALTSAYGWGTGWVRASLQASRQDQATPTDNPFRADGVFVAAGQQVGEDTLLGASYRDSYSATPIPWVDPSGSPRVYDPARQDADRNQQIIGTLRSALSPSWMLDLSLGQALERRQEPNAGGPGYQPYDSRRDQAVGHLAWTPSAGAGLSLGVDAYKEFADVPDWVAGQDYGDGHHLGTYLEGNWEPRAWMRLNGSVREQWDQERFVFAPGYAPVPDTRTRKTTWKLGVNVLLGGGLRAYASGGSGFSVPVLYSVLYNAMNGGGSLQNEQSTFYRVGASWERGPWSARLEASRTDFSNLVYFDLDSYLYANGSQLRTQGVEGTLAYRTARWGAEGFWRNQEAREMDVPVAQQLTAAAVLRRPFNTLGAKAWEVLGAWRLDATWTWTGPRYEDYGGYPAVIAASRTHFDNLSLGASWAYSAALSFSLKGEHLLQPRLTVADWLNHATDGQNDAYQVFGFPAQPPTWTVEARYRF